jgi:hypothetical protein
MPVLGFAGNNLSEDNQIENYRRENSTAQPGWSGTYGEDSAETGFSAEPSRGQPSGDGQLGRIESGQSGQEDRQLGVQVGRRGEDRDRRLGGLVSRCANPQCDAGWLRFWRRRRLPVFEGGWCCSERCTRTLVTEAVSREVRARGTGVERHHRHRIPLGLLMVERGWINGKQLQEALKMQKAVGAGKLGHWLVRQGSIDEPTVTRAVGTQWGCPVLTVESYSPEALTSIMPRLFLDAFGALPLRVAAGKILYLGFEDRLDPALALAVERMTGLKVESGLVQDSVFRAEHTRTLNAKFPRAQLVDASSAPAIAATLTRTIEKALPVDSRLVRVHDCLWLRMWLRPQQGAVADVDGIRDVIYSAGSS